MCSVMFFYGFVAVGFNGLGFQHELLTSSRRDLWRELYVLDASKCGLLFGSNEAVAIVCREG